MNAPHQEHDAMINPVDQHLTYLQVCELDCQYYNNL